MMHFDLFQSRQSNPRFIHVEAIKSINQHGDKLLNINSVPLHEMELHKMTKDLDHNMHNTWTRTRNPKFLVKPDLNLTQSQKALLVKACF